MIENPPSEGDMDMADGDGVRGMAGRRAWKITCVSFMPARDQ